MIFVVVAGLQGESEGRACQPPGALWTRRRRSAPRDRRLPNRDAGLAVLRELGPVTAYRRIEIEVTAFGEDRQAERGALSHQAGLLGTASGLTTGDFCSRRAAEKLARERPVWLPGSAFGYHRRTLGAIMEELALRITGITLQDFCEAEGRNPRGIDMFIGLPVDQEPRFVPTRYATGPSRPESGPSVGLGPGSLFALALGHEERIPPKIPELRRYGPVANGGVGSARGLARVYACVLDAVVGPRLINSDTVAAFAQQQVFGTCLMTRQVTGFGIVFERPGPDQAYGSYQALGHRGANGSLGFCDPVFGVAFGFVRQPGIIGGFAPEAMSLAATVRACAKQAAARRA
jgi:CubicO group peptidase (beta-lactamase class C family)